MAASAPKPDNADALRGAALAFGKPAVKPKPGATASSSVGNGALAAASRAGRDADTRSNSSRSVSQSRGPRDQELRRVESLTSGGSSGNDSYSAAPELGLVKKRLNQLVGGEGTEHLQLQRPGADRGRTPSYIAASLAVSRSVPASPQHTGQQAPRERVSRTASFRSQSTSRSASYSREEDVLDTTSIPPTTSLIGMFEQSTAGKPAGAAQNSGSPRKPAKKPQPVPITMSKGPPSELKTPKPIRAQTLAIKPSPDPISKSQTGNHVRTRSVPDVPDMKPKPRPVRKRESSSSGPPSDSESFVSASDNLSPAPPVTANRPSIPTSTSSFDRQVSSLANAIVASTLAASRSNSPATTTSHSQPPPPPPSRRTHHQPSNSSSLFPPTSRPPARTPSPSKISMRQTMRGPPKASSDDELRRGRKHRMTKPNKHHEGDRKRWRDVVTERERKRYEAVWASNRGLLLPTQSSMPTSTAGPQPPNPQDAVSALAVRDIWGRSRPSADTLAEVWELVDRSRTGALAREEFVAGMWLVDQRLKGRKLPTRVGDSVWASLASLGGVKIRGTWGH